MTQLIARILILTAIVLAASAKGSSQTEIPDILKKGSIPEQLKYLEEHTRIYDNYRAIREDMFRNISKNTIDSVAKAKNRISGLLLYNTGLNNRIDSLKQSLEKSKNELDMMTSTKNSLRVLGIEVNKSVYNTLMWSLLGALVFLLIAGFLAFRMNRAITLRTKKDLNDLKEEFEAYRTKSRLDREKMAIDHFHEIKRLKGK